MSTIAGLPAHILLNHFVVVLMPLTAVLLIICAVWPAARQRLVWLVLVLALVTLVITPITVAAGEWLGEHVDETAAADAHMELGEHATLFAALPLFVAALLLAGLHVMLQRRTVRPLLHWGMAAIVIVGSGWTMYQIHSIGESGARAAWGSCC